MKKNDSSQRTIKTDERSRGFQQTEPASLECLVEAVIHGAQNQTPVFSEIQSLAQEVLRFDSRKTKVVILGGGTGLSMVVGGNVQSEAWPHMPFVGLKQDFPRLQVIVCTTDDGGSTGKLLKQLPMIAIGDLRKTCVSLIRSDNLQRTYRISLTDTYKLVTLIQRIFNYRFAGATGKGDFLLDPLLILPEEQRASCPSALAQALREFGAYIAPGGEGPAINPAGHCLGNLLFASAIFKAAGGCVARAPGIRENQAGINTIARLIGVTSGLLHPVTATPGQLKFRYANGVEVYGQSKSALVRRGYPVEQVLTVFNGKPRVSAVVCRALREADVIIYAPGSLYTSIMPLLQLPPIIAAIRANQKALKILGANFWIQEGETDVSSRKEGQDFCISELIEAYDHNVPGGKQGLFHLVLSANLEHMPGNILRNYALEDKRPIYLDRTRVKKLGVQPVEATLFSIERQADAQIIYHDPVKFSLAIRTLIYARQELQWIKIPTGCVSSQKNNDRQPSTHGPLLCNYRDAIKNALNDKEFNPPVLKDILVELAWDNRDILPEHFQGFSRVQVIPAQSWQRSNAWDNVMGFYDPDDGCLKLHEHLLDNPFRLRENLLIALGESLLGGYIEERRWIKHKELGFSGTRCYEINLRPENERNCFLTPVQLHKYLKLARMIPVRHNRRCYRFMINNHEGFLPSGLLFGLMYAWYLNNAYGGIMEYEMSLLRWSPSLLIPHQAKERIRKQALISFFRNEVFRHNHA